jgi:hypothetical protein
MTHQVIGVETPFASLNRWKLASVIRGIGSSTGQGEEGPSYFNNSAGLKNGRAVFGHAVDTNPLKERILRRVGAAFRYRDRGYSPAACYAGDVVDYLRCVAPVLRAVDSVVDLVVQNRPSSSSSYG